MLDGSPRSADVVALEATESFVVYRRDLMPILRSSGDAMLALVEGLCAMIRSTNTLVESYAMKTTARCAACLTQLAAQHGRETTDGGVMIDLSRSATLATISGSRARPSAECSANFARRGSWS